MPSCRILLVVFLLTVWAMGFAQADSVSHRIILVGDAGQLTNGRNPELELLRSLYDLNGDSTSVIFLGDNIYPKGLPPADAKNYDASRHILDTQVNVADGTKARAFIIPGNHDWRNGKKGGWQQLLHQFKYVSSLQKENVLFYPEDACPGPVEIRISAKIVLVIADTQWWLHPFEKPGIESDCACKTREDMVAALKGIVYRNRDKILLFAAHHPFKTYGPHGGYFTVKQHIFPLTDLSPLLYIPLPVIGSIYPVARSVFGNIQDTKHPLYRKMIRDLDGILSTHPYCIRVSGHEHTLQWITDQGNNYIVSGAGSKMSRVKKKRSTRFAAGKTGFAVLEHLRDGRIWIKFFSSMNARRESPLFSDTLQRFAPMPVSDTPRLIRPLPDSMTLPGSTGFRAGAVKELLFGRNYRREWGEPVKIPVLDIGSEKGGLQPLQMGGGKQSRSLRLQAADGSQYVLRSIEKSPEKAIPEGFRQTFVKDVLRDGISASYPYAALSVPALAARAGIPHASPRLFFMPDDARLGIYSNDFANTLNLLEEREPGRFEKTISTDKLYEKLAEDNDNRVDERTVLKARLLDMFIMDFDRHEDQWRWGLTEAGKEHVYYPIPRDRDQAFFTNDGIFPFIAKMPWLIPQLQGLRAHSGNINGFNLPARNFDRAFMTTLTAGDWKSAAADLVNSMDDSAIEQALRSQPAEIYPYSANRIVGILKRRRTYLQAEAVRYYHFLSRTVTVVGSDKRERFEVTGSMDGSKTVTVFKVSREGEKGRKLFERRFLPAETREVRLFGLAGDDIFSVQGSGNERILVRALGGEGIDSFSYSGPPGKRPRMIIYDGKRQESRFNLQGRVRQELSDDPQLNSPDRRGFKYDVIAPLITASYNRDDGLYLGASVKSTKQGFRKEPYRSVFQATVNHALATKAYNFGLSLEQIDVIGKADLLFYGNIKAPNNTINFFGYGNETEYIKGKSEGIRYYRARFNVAEAALLLRVNPAQAVSLSAGPAFQYFSMDPADNRGRLITMPALNGLDSATLFKRKMYGGLLFSAVIDNRDNPVMPARGINWQTSFKVNRGLNGRSSDYSQLNSDLSLFMSFDLPARLVIATRLGAGINFGRYEFFQSQFLSGTENLRGFRKYRFAGDRILYSNTEIRLKLTDLNTYLFPGALGVLGFFDAGKVWAESKTSDIWHKGYGAGVWIAPLGRFVVTASYTASEEGGLPLVTFGFQF